MRNIRELTTVHEHKRADRIGEQIREEVAAILLTRVKDPRVTSVTVSSVYLSKDLANAKIFIRVQPGQDPKAVFIGLKRSAGFVRAELARRLSLRRTPEVVFLPDTLAIENDHLLELLDRVKEGVPMDDSLEKRT